MHSLDLNEINAASWGSADTQWGNASGANDFGASGRSQDISVATGTTEVGVYVELYRPWVTGFFPGPGTLISGETIMRLEPVID